MSRKITKKETEAVLWLFIILIPIILLIKFIELIGPFLFIVLLILAYWYYDKKKERKN